MEAKTAKAKKDILITGAAGALAQQVITRLRNRYRIIAVDFREQVYLGDDIPSYRIDMNKRGFEDIFRRYNIKGVIHLGRMIASEENRMRRYNSNVLGSERLFTIARKYGVEQTLVLSTYHVYGANAYNPALIDESAPLKAAELTMDLVDSVELENLSQIYLWKYPELKMTILRPCNIVGPGVKNAISTLLSAHNAPVLAGFSPMMQFLHIDDMADAIVLAFSRNQPGVYNVATEDWVAYQTALTACGCRRIPIPSVPPVLPRTLASLLDIRGFPPYLLNYFKYPVILDGSAFNKAFGFKPRYTLKEIFRYYKAMKS
ncbi:MAG: SDR family oxidoreductase [Hahellaceae bacterium]|nr:SDR family oxidoreductase [Hahellaceae bacterium]